MNQWGGSVGGPGKPGGRVWKWLIHCPMITLQSRELAMFELLAPLAINIKHGNSIGQQTRPTRTADGQGRKIQILARLDALFERLPFPYRTSCYRLSFPPTIK